MYLTAVQHSIKGFFISCAIFFIIIIFIVVVVIIIIVIINVCIMLVNTK